MIISTIFPNPLGFSLDLFYKLALTNMLKLFSQIYRSGYINSKNRQQLQHFLLQESLSEEEKKYLDRIFYAVRQGWVKNMKNF